MPKLNPHRPAGNFVAIYASRTRKAGETEAEALERARRELPTLARLADQEAGERRRQRRKGWVGNLPNTSLGPRGRDDSYFQGIALEATLPSSSK